MLELLYDVHMKRVTASEARKNWFRLLDEVAQGEVVCVERNGKRIVLQADEEPAEAAAVPDYRALLEVPDAASADLWGWEWAGPGQDLAPKVAVRGPEREP